MKVEKLGFGMMRLPQTDDDLKNIDFPTLEKMVDTFLESGFNYFDTSYVYHEGVSENAARKALVERHDRSEYYLATKLPCFAIKEEKEVKEIFEKQLENCGVEYFDYYLLHCLERILYRTTVREFKMFEQAYELKKEGKIKQLGFSWHDSAEELDKVLIDHPEIDFVQIIVNYYDWDSSWIQARKCYDVIRKHGKDIIVMEPVKGGALADVPAELEQKMRAIEPAMSPASWAIRYTADLEGVITVLSGMTTLEQVLDNASYMQDFKALTKEEKEMLQNAVPMIRKQGPYGVGDFKKYEGIEPNGMPVAEVLENYNSCMIQKSSFAENNYYKSLRFENGINESWISGIVLDNEGNDITQMVADAEKYLLENSY